jgi:NAD-dependent DNA ligase
LHAHIIPNIVEITPNKRPTLESPQELPATSKQQTRQARHRSTSVGEKGRSALVCTENKNSSAQKKLTLL